MAVPVGLPHKAAMTAAPHRPMNAAEWALLILLSLLWGGSFFFTGVAVAALPPLTIVALRVGLAALILNLALRPMGLSLPADRRVWAAFVGMGILNNVVPFSLIVFGQTRIGSGLAAILNATTPLFAVVVAHLATPDERLTPARLAGVALGLLGVVAMVGPAALHGLGGALAAQIACLAAALSYAVAGWYGRRFQALGVAPPATAAGMLTASAALIAPLALLVDRPWTLPWPGPAAVAALYRCLVRHLVGDTKLHAGRTGASRAITEENCWRAQRYGIHGSFVDEATKTAKPVGQFLAEVLDMVEEDAKTLDCTRELDLCRWIIARGTSADQQLTLYTEGLGRGLNVRDALAGVVDWLSAETVGDTGVRH